MSEKTAAKLTHRVTKGKPAVKATVVDYGLQCLPADEHMQIPIRAGQRYVVSAQVSNGCDNRGWTWDNGAHWVGPLGGAGMYAGDAMIPQVVLGALVGAISNIDGGASTDEGTMRRIFGQGPIYVGAHRDDTSPVDGWLYLLMNDNWTWGDDKGSLLVSVATY